MSGFLASTASAVDTHFGPTLSPAIALVRYMLSSRAIISMPRARWSVHLVKCPPSGQPSSSSALAAARRLLAGLRPSGKALRFRQRAREPQLAADQLH